MGLEISINSLEELCDLMCDNKLPEHHYYRCLRCGRVLKSEEAKLKGYGKICEQKMQAESHSQLF